MGLYYSWELLGWGEADLVLFGPVLGALVFKGARPPAPGFTVALGTGEGGIWEGNWFSWPRL
jgi:hypothetical protein